MTASQYAGDLVAEVPARTRLVKQLEPASKAADLPHLCECDLGECRTDLLPLLYEMSRIVTESGDLSNTLKILLKLMERHMNVVRGMVSLYQPESGKIFVHESFGLTEEEAARGVYFLGEGITGKVVESGETIVVPRISEEPNFLNRTGSRTGGDDKRLSFLCVPIMRGKKVMGTISAERIYDNKRLLKLDVEVLSILAATTAQAVELYLVENIDKVELENENRRLRNALKEKFKPSNIIGNSKPMQEVYRVILSIIR
ncbi:MAG: GAF domain-containing protein, partial [Zoogloea sp.]|nr:GAF domain-containing protein [Zoogloea sp.]